MAEVLVNVSDIISVKPLSRIYVTILEHNSLSNDHSKLSQMQVVQKNEAHILCSIHCPFKSYNFWHNWTNGIITLSGSNKRDHTTEYVHYAHTS